MAIKIFWLIWRRLLREWGSKNRAHVDPQAEMTRRIGFAVVSEVKARIGSDSGAGMGAGDVQSYGIMKENKMGCKTIAGGTKPSVGDLPPARIG
jgi:hypothetical protein